MWLVEASGSAMRRHDFIRVVVLQPLGRSLARTTATASKNRRTCRWTPPDRHPFWTIFREALSDLGYVDGHNIELEYRSAEGDKETV